MSSSDLAIRVEHLSKSYGELKAVDDLSFTVERGRCTAFLGPNGAGKTTTIKALYGKARFDPSADTVVEVLGFPIPAKELEAKCRMGLVPQEDSLDEQLDVERNLYVFSKLYGLSPASARKRIADLLEFMDLTEKARSRVRELSGGMKRRLVIARALLNEPELLILDEPTTGLDPQARHHIWDKVRALMRTGVTVVITTHYMDEAWQLADEIMIMDKGKLILNGDPKKLMAERMEAHVLELHRPELVEDHGSPAAETLRKLRDTTLVRVERSEARFILYSNDEAALASLASQLPSGSFLVRRSSLEDLFLTATGRKIDE